MLIIITTKSLRRVIVSEIDRLNVIVAEIREAIAAADAQIVADAERDAALAAAADAQIEELAGQIEVPGIYAGDPEPEPEPELGGDEEDPE